jgi:hypothetical protein
MPIFNYKFTHSAGSGDGIIEAASDDKAREKITALLQPSDKKSDKLKNLSIEITEQEQPGAEN